MPGVMVVYLGLLTALAGAVSLVRPRFLPGMDTRGHAALAVAAGLGLLVAGWALPAEDVRVAAPSTGLDRFLPVYQFSEFHSINVRAPKERVYRAIQSVSAGEITLFGTLTWIRRLGRPGPESILNAPERQPILEVATRTSFLLLAEEPGREIVIGTLVLRPRGWRPGRRPTPEDFRALREPGYALAAMNFVVADDGAGGSTVTTETRVFATDASARRRFAAYWRIIYPGSALLRRSWLRAIARRAESPDS